jgi:UDP-N-acetylglucosamine 1-carboxyvinyltransferase
MGTFVVNGGKPLSGTLTPQGAKNEALQVICASLLTDEAVTIRNVPNILDVTNLISLLDAMGVVVNNPVKGTYTFHAKEIDLDYLRSDEFREKGTSLRGSIMVLGPLLARFGKGYVPAPGGDKIGRRRLDTHFTGFQRLGASFTYDQASHLYSVDAPALQGCYMLLDEASVTGTANILMCAVLARGITTI